LALLLIDLAAHRLTANPIQAVEQRTGIYALSFLLASLACTPVASILGLKEFIRRRKALGIYGFFYAVLHLTTFFAVDYGLDFAAVWRDVGNKAYIIIGAVAFVLLLPLAITSFTYWMKRLGKNWKRLHRLVYLIAPLAVAHFLLSAKGDITQLRGNLAEPLLYGAIALFLLVLRVSWVKSWLIRMRHAAGSFIRFRSLDDAFLHKAGQLAHAPLFQPKPFDRAAPAPVIGAVDDAAEVDDAFHPAHADTVAHP
jgi:methionine sulfoxide reductase heme-binding subunit